MALKNEFQSRHLNPSRIESALQRAKKDGNGVSIVAAAVRGPLSNGITLHRQAQKLTPEQIVGFPLVVNFPQSEDSLSSEQVAEALETLTESSPLKKMAAQGSPFFFALIKAI